MWVAVAITDAGPVGVDIEQIVHMDYQSLLDVVCTTSERLSIHGISDFYAYWTRKESLLKAVGAGLQLPMIDISVTPPSAPPELIRWLGHDDLKTRMRPTSPAAGYAGTTTVITSDEVSFVTLDGSELLV
jgi:4'-phosphopantetheinyl transferase